MLSAVDLEEKVMLKADEIGDERADRVLATEFCAIEGSHSEPTPYGSLGIRHVAAEAACGADFCALPHFPRGLYLYLGDQGAGRRILFSWRLISGRILAAKACQSLLEPRAARRRVRSS